MKNRRIFYGISIAMVVIGCVSLATRGLDQGVDFTGGRNFIIKFEKPVNNIEIANMLEKSLGTSPTVITYGSEDKVRVTTKYGIESDDPEVSEQIQRLLYQGLAPFSEAKPRMRILVKVISRVYSW